MKLSIVIPVYYNEDNLVPLYEDIKKKVIDVIDYEYEIVMVNDGSKDRTDELCRTLHPVKYINLRKNFGQTAAMDAGIQAATKEYIVTMDGDRQNDPNDIPAMLAYLTENNLDIVINDTLDFADLWNSTLGNNATLLLAAQNNTLAQLDYKKVLSRNYPYVKLRAGYDYGFNKYGNNTMIRRNAWGGNAGISIGFNLWDGNRRREMRNAKIEMENVKLMHDQLELSLKANLGNFWHAYQNNLQMLELEKTNVITARENHEIAKERYMLGDLSGIEMREAQQSLLDAEERLLSVEYDTKLCEISLMQISGKITDLIK